MLKTFELPEVLTFVEELKAKRSGCLGGRYCSRLDKLIACQFEVCRELNQAIASWKFRVFRGLIEHNQAVDSALREQIAETLELATSVLKLAFDREAECFEFSRLDELNRQIRMLYRHEVKWVHPRRAVRPAYRTSLTPEQISAMQLGLASVPSCDK